VPNKQGFTCAHIAATKGSVAVLKELMKFNVEVVKSARIKVSYINLKSGGLNMPSSLVQHSPKVGLMIILFFFIHYFSLHKKNR